MAVLGDLWRHSSFPVWNVIPRNSPPFPIPPVSSLLSRRIVQLLQIESAISFGWLAVLENHTIIQQSIPFMYDTEN